ncbi:hypothetical protein ACQPZ8_37545 [Actinomadura nitritigenes]|uniref:hypothetical protein n=1 Tax=Actinomadura nitritigenes TaxID=134602 RepID=UPI003D8CC40D
MTGQDAGHLDRLAAALVRANWTTEKRYDGTPPLLRVFLSGRVGESIRVKPRVNGVPWFVSSTGNPLAPCHDAERAVREMATWWDALVRGAADEWWS